jgi:LysM repeat protein
MLFGQPGDGSAPPKAVPKPAQIGETGAGIVGEAPAPSQPAVYIPVVKAAPDNYGYVIHEVQPGQTIIAIAIAYDVSPDDIWRLNDMPKDATLIRPGDRLVVQAPPTPTPTASDTPTISPTWQRAVTATPSPLPGTELPPTRIAAAATPPPAPPNLDTSSSSPAPTSTLSQQVWPIVGALLALVAIGRGWLAHRRRQVQN